MAEGIRRGDPDAEIRCLPMADGGEGTARALADATGGTMLTAGAHDPLGRPVQAGFALLGDGRTAVVETAAASGLALLRPSERDPKATTSYGTGELILAALDAGATTLLGTSHRQAPVKQLVASIREGLREFFDLRPYGLIQMLDLLHPIYKETAAYGHFGREHFPWEKTDKAALLREAAGLK